MTRRNRPVCWRTPAATALAALVMASGAAAQAPKLPPALDERAADTDRTPFPLPGPARPDDPEPPPPSMTDPVSPAVINPPGTSDPQGLPIDLPTALRVAGVRPLDIATAEAGVNQARGLLTQARVLWIPNINGGMGYYHHDNGNQNLFNGQGFDKSTNALIVGGGPTLSVGGADAIFAPLAARRVVNSRDADVQTARNNSVFSVAQAYFTLQQARGRIGGLEATLVRADRLVEFTRGLAPSLIAPLEINRAEAEALSLRQDLELARRDERVASAQLAEILLLDPEVVLTPLEPPFLQMSLIPCDERVQDLVMVGLKNRPELASRRELLVAAEQLVRREVSRPFIPNVIMTTPGTANAGLLSAGQFYTGSGSGNLNNHSSREDFTLALVWQLQNGGFGNVGLIRQRKAEQQAAAIEVTRVVYRVRSEVSQALARLQTARARVPQSEEGLRQATESADKNFVGLRQTARPAGQLLTLVVRPQEVNASIIALNTAFLQYFTAIANYNTAQFEVYRALGQPGQWVTAKMQAPVAALPSAGPR